MLDMFGAGIVLFGVDIKCGGVLSPLVLPLDIPLSQSLVIPRSNAMS
jgi:hypothetical protein